jgi:hypothetical protein
MLWHGRGFGTEGRNFMLWHGRGFWAERGHFMLWHEYGFGAGDRGIMMRLGMEGWGFWVFPAAIAMRHMRVLGMLPTVSACT